MKISVIIPVYNEVDSLQELHHELTRVLSDYIPYEILFIDDGSSDGSVELIKRLSQSDSAVNLIEFHRNYGKSAALSEGFKYAQGDYVVLQNYLILLPDWSQVLKSMILIAD